MVCEEMVVLSLREGVANSYEIGLKQINQSQILAQKPAGTKLPEILFCLDSNF